MSNMIPNEVGKGIEMVQNTIVSTLRDQHNHDEPWLRKICLEAATEIERLRSKADKQAMMLRYLTPEKFPGTLFIHSVLGTKDENNMPKHYDRTHMSHMFKIIGY